MNKNTSSGRAGGPLSLRNPHPPSRGTKGNSSRCRPSASPFHEDHRQEREALRAELETERLRSKEAQRLFAIEARELREAAEQDRQLLADQLRSKWEQQRARELQQLREETKKHREAEIRQLLRWKEAELREAQEFLQRERDEAMRQARELQRQLAKELVSHGSASRGARGGSSGGGLSTECQAKLEEVLGKLRWEVDGDQAIRIRHLEAELELERRLFLKYILERFEKERLLAGSLNRFLQASSSPEGKVNSWGDAGEHAEEGLPQQGWLSGDSSNQLRKQNADLLNARKVLEERCAHLEEENARLRKNSSPDIQEKVKILKGKSAELAVIAKRLEAAAEKLEAFNIRASDTPVPVALDCSERELWDNVFAHQHAKDLNDQESDQEFQAKLSSRKKNSLFNISDLDCLLRESEREALQSRRLTALKSQGDSLETSRIAANDSSSGILPEAASTIHVCLVKKKPKTANVLKKDEESQTLPCGDDTKSYENSGLKRDSKNESHLQLLEKQLIEKKKQCENLRYELEEKQKQRDEAELKRHKILSESTRLSEENAQLREKNKQAEKMANENADLKVKLIQSNNERNSVFQLTRGLEIKVQSLERMLKDMEERGERQQQLEAEHKKTLLELQRKEEEIQQLQQAQTEMSRGRHEVQFLEAQGKELEHLYPCQTERVDQYPFRLRLFLAQYSYDPFKGPNQNPEAELPLTAGEYVCICGEMDEDGFYVGELIDGRRGFVPSNLVEEVTDNDLFGFLPSEPSNISYDSIHDPSFSCQSASCEEKNNSPDDNRCVSLLSDGLEGMLYEVQTAVPYPQNLTLLNLRNITATSAEITWFPSNGSYTYLLYLNEKKYDVTKAGIYCYTFQNLRPSTQYSVKVEPRVPQEAFGSPQEGWDQKVAEMTFTTLSAGPPHAPLDVQVQASSSRDILLISWLPETIHPSGSSNGVRVTGYAIYISGQKVTEITSPTAGSVSLDVSRISPFQGPRTVSVRTVSPYGESADSVPAFIPSDLQKVPTSALFPSVISGLTFQEFLDPEGRPIPASEGLGKKRSEVSWSQNRIT